MDIYKLLDTLTIEEKIGQLMQLPPFFFVEDIKEVIHGHVKHLNLNQTKIFEAGSVLGNHSAEQMIKVQDAYLKESRHKIPLMFMADIIHGFKTIFPVPLALAASFNPEFAYQSARIQAIESRVSGIQVTFSPMVDVSRDPRWGRVVEGFGEDPYLSSVFSKSSVKGYQGKDIKNFESVASCVKHFAAYGASEAGRDYNTVDVSNFSLFNTYLPSYKAAIDADAKLIMTSFNTIDNIPATVNKHLLKDILRDQWGFKGITISDYDSLHQVVTHGVAKDAKEAALRAIDAGLDIEMASTCYNNHLKTLLDEKKIDEKQINEAVYRVLKLKDELGLFDDPYSGADPIREKEVVLCHKHLELAEKAALESMVLLKNEENILPLKKELHYVILGPYADTIKTNGPWFGHGNNEINQKLSDQLTKLGIKIDFVKSSIAPEYNMSEMKMIKQADQIILALGEDEHESGEAHSKVDINLPREQDKFITFAQELKKEVITVLYHGRPFVLTNILSSKAILDVFYLGSRANEAIAKILTGIANPSGKLPMTYPRHGGQIPIYYNHLNTGRPHKKNAHHAYTSFYLDEENEPLFPFGFGMSYAKFEYSNLKASQSEMHINDKITVSIDVSNLSEISGYETIQLYVRDLVSYYARPVKELKGFKKVWFEAREKRNVQFEISKNDLCYYNPKGETLIECGEFEIMVGANSEELDSLIIVLV